MPPNISPPSQRQTMTVWRFRWRLPLVHRFRSLCWRPRFSCWLEQSWATPSILTSLCSKLPCLPWRRDSTRLLAWTENQPGLRGYCSWPSISSWRSAHSLRQHSNRGKWRELTSHLSAGPHPLLVVFEDQGQLTLTLLTTTDVCVLC